MGEGEVKPERWTGNRTTTPERRSGLLFSQKMLHINENTPFPFIELPDGEWAGANATAGGAIRA